MAGVEAPIQLLGQDISRLYDSEEALRSFSPVLLSLITYHPLREELVNQANIAELQMRRLKKLAPMPQERFQSQKSPILRTILSEGLDDVRHSALDPDSVALKVLLKAAHYRIAAYQWACAAAERLDAPQLVSSLQQSLDEASAFANKLLSILRQLSGDPMSGYSLAFEQAIGERPH